MPPGFLKELRHSDDHSADKPDYVERTLLGVLIGAALIALTGFSVLAFRFL